MFCKSTLGAALALVLGLAACTDQSTEPDRTAVQQSTDSVSAPADLALSGSTVTVIAAGDVAACAANYKDEATARLVDRIAGTLLALGDLAYPDGSAANYRCYNASWGRFKSRTRPTPGNHEYHSAGAGPYFNYFGAQAGPSGRGYYSFNLGSWHIVSLNSERNIPTQARWLTADLAANRSKCILAYWHRPFFTSGLHPPWTAMRPLVQILYDAGADIVLTGHNHQYERFSPQTPAGRANALRGIVEFVVGTGGSGSLYNFVRSAPNSAARYKGYGVLKLELKPTSYTYTYVPLSGTFRDTGTRNCH